MWSQTRPGDASSSPAVTAELIEYRPSRAQKGPLAGYTRAAHVRIDLYVVVMIYASCAEQKTALQKLFVVPNASRRRLVVSDTIALPAVTAARGTYRLTGHCP